VSAFVRLKTKGDVDHSIILVKVKGEGGGWEGKRGREGEGRGGGVRIGRLGFKTEILGRGRKKRSLFA
jgi:hypothetical protein